MGYLREMLQVLEMLTGYVLLVFFKWFSNEFCDTKTNESNCNGQSQQTKTTQWTNENSKQIHITGAKCGKTHATKSWLVLVLYLIGREGGVSFLNQSLHRA